MNLLSDFNLTKFGATIKGNIDGVDVVLGTVIEGKISIEDAYRNHGELIDFANSLKIRQLRIEGESSAVITDSVNQIDIQEFIEQSIHRTVNDDTPYDFGVLSAKAIKAIQKHTGLNLSGYSCKIYPSYVRHIKNRHPEQLVLLTKINNMLNSINYAIKEIGKNSKTGKTETYILLFTKQDENVIKLVKIRDYAKKELSIKTIHALDEADQKLPLSLRLSFDAIKPQTLRHYPKSDGFTHQKDDKSIIPKNTNQVNIWTEQKQ